MLNQIGMKNLEKIADTVAGEGAEVEMEDPEPIAAVEEKESNKPEVNKSNGAITNKNVELIIESDNIPKGHNKDTSSVACSESSEINGLGENALELKMDEGESCNGKAEQDDRLTVKTSSELNSGEVNGDSTNVEQSNPREITNGEENDKTQLPTKSSPQVSDSDQGESVCVNSDKEDEFKMPNTIEELLDDEGSKDESSQNKESTNETTHSETSKNDDSEERQDMEIETSEPKELCSVESSKVDALKPEAGPPTHSVDVLMEEDTKKLVSEEDVDMKESSDEAPNPFVDETSPEPEENGINVSEKQDKQESKCAKENASQISLESVDQVGSEDDNSDDDLDINAGLDKCFSALEKEISKDENMELPNSSNVQEEHSNKLKAAVDVDDSSRDVSNVPSEAEEGGNEADDEGESRISEPVVLEEPDQDLDQALGELEMIEKTTKKILDDESESLKRPHEEPSEPSNKKAKVDESLDETGEVVKNRKIKKVLKKMTRNDLEDLIANKMVEVMTNKSEIGKLRHQCDSFQESVEKWKRRAQALSKQCTDLSTVMRKYITDSKSRPRDKVAPVRITRSVGLQVMTPDQRRLQQQRQNLNRSRVQEKAIAPGAVQKPVPTKPTLSNGVVKQVNQSSGLASTTSSQLPRTVGGTTISPAKTSPASVRNTGSVTITQTKTPTPNSTSKPVIDVVDLSDDEGTPAPPPPKPTPPPARQTPTSIVRSTGPRQQGQQFIMQGNQLYPVRQQQAMARQNLQANRPVMAGRPRAPIRNVHPAPLPPMPNPQPNSPNWKLLPPRPALKISKVNNGIVLSWNMNLNLATHATIASYQLYAYQESAMQRPDPSLWKKVGDVKALPLPMACTLTQFTRGNKYHFAVRAMDGHSRVGQFSDPNSIVLN